jgi:hypothetical protein
MVELNRSDGIEDFIFLVSSDFYFLQKADDSLRFASVERFHVKGIT